MNEETHDEGLALIKRVQVVGAGEINDKLLNGWILLRILTKRVDGEEIPRFVIGRKAVEMPKS